MLSENYISTLLNIDSWEIFSPFTKQHPLENVSLTNKDITKHHNDYEILVGLEGIYPYYYNGACYCCKPGSIFLISPMLEHESYYTGVSNPLTHIWLNNVTQDSLLVGISKIINNKPKCIFRSKVSYSEYTPKLEIFKIWNLLLKAKKITPQDMLKLKLAICHLFYIIIQSKQLSNTDYKNEIMLQARDYIKEHFHQKIDISQLARKMGYSKFHFMRLFKECHAVTVHEYIDQQRLKRVNELLANKTTQKEIAFQLGFSSRTSFANWYAKHRNND
jgi:AraC-like DNA-binding protein